MHADWLNVPASSCHHYPAWLTQTTVSVLADYALLACQGPDSAKFLQGQLTCNLNDITASTSRPGAHCTPKGRMVTNFLLAQTSEHEHMLRIHHETLPALQQSLGKYIVFSKAKLRDASDEYLLLGIQGPEAAKVVASVFGSAPALLHGVQTHDHGLVIRISHEPRFECWLSAASASTLWATMTRQGAVTGSAFWHWLNIRAGIGEIRRQTIEEFIPQMLNLQLMDGISFTKGCYTGQEIVARMQYRGTLKRNLYGISGTGLAPAPAVALLQDNSEQASGHVVMAEPAGDDCWEGLAVIQHDAVELPLHLANKEPVRLRNLTDAIQHHADLR